MAQKKLFEDVADNTTKGKAPEAKFKLKPKVK